MRGTFHHYERPSVSAVADAGAVAQKAIGPVPEGFVWYVEIVGYVVIGNSHTAVIAAAISPDNGPLPAQATWDGAGMVWTTLTAAIRNSENTGPPFFLDSGEYLRAILSGGTLAQGDVVTVTYQIRVNEKEPVWGLLTPEERAELAAAHERAGLAPAVGLPAVAEERAV